MAHTEFGTNDPQTVKHWSSTLLRETISKTYFQSLMGSGADSPIQRLTELESNAGDQIKYDLLYQMEQYGVEGDNPIRGFEEALTYAQDSVLVDQRRIAHAFRRMSQQRTLHGLREDAKRNLSDRWSVILDQILFAQLAGTAGDNVALPAAHAGNTLVSPSSDTDHYLNLSSDTMGTNVIEIALEKANTIDPLIRPARGPWGSGFILIIHPINVYDLRVSTSGNIWQEITKFAYMGGKGSTPFHTYEVGRWGDVTILASRYIPRTGNTAHCLFLGAQAGVIAFANAYSKARQGSMGGGNLMSWAEETDDYGNEMGVAGGSVFGCKPCIFTKPGTATAKRFGMIRIDLSTIAHTDPTP